MTDVETPTRVPNEAVADLHKALAKEAKGGYSTMGGSVNRSKSDGFAHERGDEAARLKTPGGFRRHYMNDQADAKGVPQERRPITWRHTFIATMRRASMLHSDAALGIRLHPSTGAELPPEAGNADLLQTGLALVKSFVGSGITFLPGAFAHGGWLFSAVMILAIAAVNALCIRLLIECSVRVGCQSFGGIAELAAGLKGKVVVQVSLVISQFGVCIAYIIFVSQLAESMHILNPTAVIFLELAPLVPLCLIRSVESLEYPNLAADVLILFGVGMVIVSTICALFSKEIQNPHVEPFQHGTFGIFIGMAVFTFEGIPMILPIQSAMRDPDAFWPLFSKLFAAIAVLFTIFGLLGYLAWGGSVETVVLLNLPHNSGLSIAVKIGYMFALILGLPLMFLPAARITELWMFGVVKAGEYTWRKNALRATEVVVFCVIALKSGHYFDKFLAFTGALCCAPIAFIYPAIFHYRLCAETRTQQVLDFGIVVLGIVAVGFALYGSL